MDGVIRRASGVYVARLVVPPRHRQTLGKQEFIASTGTREIALAKIVAGQLVAHWRRQLQNLDRQKAGMDVLQLSLGSPLLLAGGFLPLGQAAQLSGFDADELLRFAADGKLGLYTRANGLAGHVITEDDCERFNGPSGAELTVPTPAQMPDHVSEIAHHGVLKLREPKIAASAMLADEPTTLVLLDLVPANGRCLAPVQPLQLLRDAVEVDCAELERLRTASASHVTQAQIDAVLHVRQAVAAVQLPPAKPANPNGELLMSEAIEQFMATKSTRCKPDHARRIQAACDLFVELQGDLRLADVTRPLVRSYRDDILPKVPSKENKIRLMHRTRSIKESMAAVAGTDWPVLSAQGCVMRMTWLSNLFTWLFDEQLIDRDLAKDLGRYSGASQVLRSKKKRKQDERQPFSRADLGQIFGAQWYTDGRGLLTKQGTYREFLPFYYWGPLIGLYTGARINEIAQLSLRDIDCVNGAWYFDFNEDDDDLDVDASAGAGTGSRGDRALAGKRLKNTNSVRKVPIHPQLKNLGLIDYCQALKAAGHTRLFTELSFDPIKGYGKGASKWFSGYLKGLGWPRDGTKVFHSFRHTVATECFNVLGLDEAVTAQISGHKRGSSVLATRYRHDIPPELLDAVERLDFNLPAIAPFDVPAGLQALQDALRRKVSVARRASS